MVTLKNNAMTVEISEKEGITALGAGDTLTATHSIYF